MFVRVEYEIVGERASSRVRRNYRKTPKPRPIRSELRDPYGNKRGERKERVITATILLSCSFGRSLRSFRRYSDREMTIVERDKARKERIASRGKEIERINERETDKR